MTFSCAPIGSGPLPSEGSFREEETNHLQILQNCIIDIEVRPGVYKP